MTGLPTSIRVGYRDYAVVDWDRRDAASVDRYGECDNMNSILRVCRDHGEQKAGNTLLHEVIHAAWYIADLPNKVDEEKAVTVLANQLAQVIRDNPDLVAYLTEALGTSQRV